MEGGACSPGRSWRKRRGQQSRMGQGWQDQESERKEGVCPLRCCDWPGWSVAGGHSSSVPGPGFNSKLKIQFLQILAQSCFAYFGALPRAGANLGPSRGENSLHCPGLFLYSNKLLSLLYLEPLLRISVRSLINLYLTDVVNRRLESEVRATLGEGLCGEATSATGLDPHPGRPRGQTCGVLTAPTPFPHGNQDHRESSWPSSSGGPQPCLGFACSGSCSGRRAQQVLLCSQGTQIRYLFAPTLSQRMAAH